MPDSNTILQQATVTIDPMRIKAIVEGCNSTTEAVHDIHRLVVQAAGIDWDRVYQLEGYVQCNEAVWKMICRWFQDKEAEHNRTRAYDKQVMPGGPWMNWGFSVSADITSPKLVILPAITMKP